METETETEMETEKEFQNLQNPYVGPRTFRQEESDRFFGREREARELFSLIVSERLVLFYAQSGAGKSSLINTRLIPQLRNSGFAVLPTGRVRGQEAQPGGKTVDNIFIYNLMTSLDQGNADHGRFARLKLTEFLSKLTSDDGALFYFDDTVLEESEAYEEGVGFVLIIDQFEEILTTHLDHWSEREDFFHQLNEAMVNDPSLWVVLSLREDFVAALEPYAPIMADKMRARYYMQRMGHEAALEAVKAPAAQAGRPFAPDVAEQLVDNLRQIRVQGADASQPGQYVEPVQLQVVCYQLWENLQDQPPGQITLQELKEAGDVDSALSDYYEQSLKNLLADETFDKPKSFEADLRHWFGQELITEAETRGFVLRREEKTGNIPTQAADILREKYFLLRSDNRAGGTWYELTHDRFIQPILASNREWELVNVAGVSNPVKLLILLALFFGMSFLCAIVDFGTRGEALENIRATAVAQETTDVVHIIDTELTSTIFTLPNLGMGLVVAGFISWILITFRNQFIVYGRLLQNQRYSMLISQIGMDIQKNLITFFLIVLVGVLLLCVIGGIIGVVSPESLE